jgi:uncharacterized ion transporter superfamily protein YfcC
MKLALPQPLVLLLGGVMLAAVLTWVLPAGQYQRRLDPGSGREVVIAGNAPRRGQHRSAHRPPCLVVLRGIVAGADVILTVLFVGGTLALLEATGALARLVGAPVGRAAGPGSSSWASA